MLRKALGIGLLSGGLDSALASRIVMDAGANVRCIHFFTGFCVTGHHARVGRTDKPVSNNALQVAAELGVSVELIDISNEYLDLVLNPRYGYGANMNPCIDCRIFMLQKAKKFMIENSADFVFTGEVIAQRPMSQMRRTIDLIEKRSGLEGRLLRPLSARLLPPTIPEEEGLIDREKLLAIHGRSRKVQIELAEQYNITSFSQPGGGCCFLTDESYSRRFRDLIQAHGEKTLTMDDIYILGVGRHFRISPGLKVVIGRDEIENLFLSRYEENFWVGRVRHFPGPTAILLGEVEDSSWRIIAAMIGRYSDGKDEEELEVEFTFGESVKVVRVSPAEDPLLEKYRI